MVRDRLGLGLDLVSGWLVVTHTYWYYFPLSLSLSPWKEEWSYTVHCPSAVRCAAARPIRFMSIQRLKATNKSIFLSSHSGCTSAPSFSVLFCILRRSSLAFLCRISFTHNTARCRVFVPVKNLCSSSVWTDCVYSFSLKTEQLKVLICGIGSLNSVGTRERAACFKLRKTPYNRSNAILRRLSHKYRVDQKVSHCQELSLNRIKNQSVRLNFPSILI